MTNVDGKNDDILYLVLFKLRLLSGISYNYHVPSSEENELTGFPDGTFLYSVVNRSSISAFAGINLQFFNYQKNHFQLSIIYSQGLNRVVTADVDYQLLSGDYKAKLGSRGSYLSLQLGYPIRIASFSRK